MSLGGDECGVDYFYREKDEIEVRTIGDLRPWEAGGCLHAL